MDYKDCNSLNDLLTALNNDVAVMDEVLLSFELERQAQQDAASAARAAAILEEK